MNYTLLFLIATLAAISTAPLVENEYENMFTKFITKYNKEYQHDEFNFRYNIFKANLDRIRRHNTEEHMWKMDTNEFTDLTWDEFKLKRVGYTRKNIIPKLAMCAVSKNTHLPDKWDWAKKGAVTPVKNQAQCGSCWAFSTTGSTEGAWFLKTGKLISLSEQQLVDCSREFGNHGCEGGLMDQGFKYIIKNGLCTEKSYPYTAQDGTCHSCKSVVKITSFNDVDPDNENALQQAVFHQPVSVAIEADQSGFQFFKSGVFDGECGTDLDHGVLVVGWGMFNNTPYWKVKNSWGKSWGDNGYIFMARNISSQHGQCGILLEPSYPAVDSV